MALGIVAICMLLGSLDSGERRYGSLLRTLGESSSLNNRLDNAILSIQSNTRSDYDSVAELQTQLRAVAGILDAHADSRAVGEALGTKLEFVEQFKSRHAILRNSLHIIPELRRVIDAEIQASDPRSGLAHAVETLEWAVFRYAWRGQRVDRGNVDGVVAEVTGRARSAILGDSEEWQFLRAHVDKVLDVAPQANRLFDSVMVIPIDSLINAARAAVSRHYERQDWRARGFLVGLFAMTIALLVLAAQRVITIWRYQSELEERVEKRTRDLKSANDRLRDEMEAKERMQQELVQAQKLESIGQLSAGVAHEINTPMQYVSDNIRFLKESFDEILAAIRSLRDMASLREPVAPEKLRACLEDADLEFLEEEIQRAIAESAEGVERVTLIVRALKEFAHPSGNKTPQDVNRAIRSTATVATNEWKYVADLDCDFDEDLPPVRCVLGEFNQVILNMIVNAAHAIADKVGDTGARGRITISTRRDGDHVRITVADTGNGIPEDIVSRVFDPFFTTKEVGKGTGQGLFIAHNVVVEKHGGALFVDSQQGVGTRFTIRIPAGDNCPDSATGLPAGSAVHRNSLSGKAALA